VDYNKGPDWGELAKGKFISAVRNGTGVCILHAADNAFRGWVEYEEICALMWREGTSHGKYHRFDIKVVDSGHPITSGLPPVIKDHPDELYHRMVHMHNAPYHVLATAYSSPESGGTGNEEPVLLVRTYGKGRVFHNILGHVGRGGPMDTFENSTFQKVLLRGCQWAGGEKVTL
jgi:type 1 glutamine amidotransferase